MNDCSLVAGFLSGPVVCCETCHHDEEMIEVGFYGNSYWVCCAVNAAAFAPQQVSRHSAEDQARVRPTAAALGPA